MGRLAVDRYIARVCFESESLSFGTVNLFTAKVLCFEALKRFWIARTVIVMMSHLLLFSFRLPLPSRLGQVASEAQRLSRRLHESVSEHHGSRDVQRS